MKCDVTKIWFENKDKLFDFIRKRVEDPVTSEDILQAVLIKVYNYCEKKANVKNLPSWLYQIAQNTIIDHFKKSSKFVPLDSNITADNLTELKPNAVYWIEPLLQFLPEEYATPLKLSDLGGLKQQEVADKLELSLTATKSRIQRARKLLRQKFEECGIVELNDNQKFNFIVTKQCCKGLVN